LATKASSKPLESMVDIWKFTLTLPPPVPLADCVIWPVELGRKISAPLSPTTTGFPFDTAPPC